MGVVATRAFLLVLFPSAELARDPDGFVQINHPRLLDHIGYAQSRPSPTC